MQTTSSGPECEGDDPSINCAGLDSITGDVCDEGSLFSLLCCDYCSPDPTTTTTVTDPTTSAQTPGPTTTGNGKLIGQLCIQKIDLRYMIGPLKQSQLIYNRNSFWLNIS